MEDMNLVGHEASPDDGDNAETTEATPVDSGSYSAEDAYKELFPGENDDSESDAEHADELAQVPETTADDVPESEADTPALDAEIAKLSPALQERWAQQWKGVEKRENRLARREAELDQVSGLVDWASKFDDAATAREHYEELGKRLAEYHGWEDKPDADTQDDFLLDSDRELYERAKRDVLRELAPFTDELKALKAERQQSAQEAQFNQFIDAVAPKTIKALSASDSGWQVTREHVAEAMRALGGIPKYADDPAAAVRAYWSDERAQHLAAQSASKVAKGPELVKSTRAKGHAPVPDHQYSAADAYRELFGD